LERPEFVDYWAYKWSDLLLVSSRKLRANAVRDFYNWIRAAVEENKPWDRFVYEIFTGSGNSRQNGALNYFALHKDPIDLTENATQAFLGQRLTCARCHNHPLEKWTQKQYYQLANMFSRIGIKNGDEPGDVVVYAKAEGNINHPRLLRPLPPAPLDGQELPLDSTVDRRGAFANWLTGKDNKQFARSIVNRIWGNFMGRGLVHPIDRERLRYQAPGPADSQLLHVSVVERSQRHESKRRQILFAIYRETASGGSAARCHVAGDRRGYALCGIPGRHPRAATSRHAGAVAVPGLVRAATTGNLRCG
jgi:hypothetical protein